MIRRIWIVTVGLALLPATVPAQTAPAAPTVTHPATQAVKAQFEMIKGVLNKTAAKVGEELYSFKPTPEVRSVGQLIGHIADSQFGMCAAAAGQQPPQSGIEKGKTSKAELSKALADSSAYCDTVLAGMNDAKGMESVKFFTGPTPRLFVLTFNIAHSYEHYGNLVTYMRLKGIVPPSSETSSR